MKEAPSPSIKAYTEFIACTLSVYAFNNTTQFPSYLEQSVGHLNLLQGRETPLRAAILFISFLWLPLLLKMRGVRWCSWPADKKNFQCGGFFAGLWVSSRKWILIITAMSYVDHSHYLPLFYRFPWGKIGQQLRRVVVLVVLLVVKTLLNQNGSEWYFSIKLGKIELNIVNYDENEIYN